MMNLKKQIGNIQVSTVSLPFAHGLDLYETMVFDYQDAEVGAFTRRYQSYDAAEAGHQETIELVEQSIREKNNA
jgi:hypothetical protein